MTINCKSRSLTLVLSHMNVAKPSLDMKTDLAVHRGALVCT